MTNTINDVKIFSKKIDDEEFDIPIDLTDIITVCKEYSNLGYKIQNQIEHIVEIGVEEALSNGFISIAALPLIKHFLKIINNNPLFGDASIQANEAIYLIENFEMKNPNLCRGKAN